MKIGIIGAGASGVFCAINLAQHNLDVTLLEKNEDTLKKLLITGNGRCNVTNLKDVINFVEGVTQNGKFIYSAISGFSPVDMVEFLNNLSVETKVENNNRVFPVTNKAITIKNAFDNCLNNVNLVLGCLVTSVEVINNKFKVLTTKGDFVFDKLIVATGGLSYPTTGSTGDGLRFAENLNILTTKTRPSLCGIRLNFDSQKLEGVSFNGKLVYKSNLKNKCESVGDFIFTNYGVSGPAVFTLTSKIVDYSISKNFIYIDFLSTMQTEQILLNLKEYIKLNPKKYVVHCVNSLVNLKLCKIILERLNIPENLQVANLKNEQLNKIVFELKNFELQIEGFDNIERATVTRGGVDVKEINPKTFECKKIKNIYFIGEVLDVDALSGGYNLQIAFSTAYACASAIIND